MKSDLRFKSYEVHICTDICEPRNTIKLFCKLTEVGGLFEDRVWVIESFYSIFIPSTPPQYSKLQILTLAFYSYPYLSRPQNPASPFTLSYCLDHPPPRKSVTICLHSDSVEPALTWPFIFYWHIFLEHFVHSYVGPENNYWP